MTNGNDPSDFTRSNAETEVVPIQSDWTIHERPSTASVEAVAVATGREPTDLPPLFDHVDADALDSLVTTGRDEPHNRVSVSFDYDGIAVTVDSHGGIEIRPDTDASE